MANIEQTRNGFAGTIYLSSCFIMGYAIVSVLRRQDSIWETLGLSAVLGPGIMGLCLIFLSMVGVVPSRLEIVLCTLPFAGVSLLRIYQSRNANVDLLADEVPATDRILPRLLMSVALLAIAYGLLVATLVTMRDPIVEWDAFSMWQFKAKLLTVLPLRPQPTYFSTIGLSQTHLRYPILAPMISAGQNAMAGGFDAFARAPSVLLLAGLSLAIFGCIHRISGRLPAFIATALILNLNTIYRWPGSGTAEMALTAFYGCSVICLLHWRHTHRWGDLILTALFSACMAWSKNEGIALAAINFFFLLGGTARSRAEQRGISTKDTKGTKEEKTNSVPLVRVLRVLRRYFSFPLAYAVIVAILFGPWQWYIRNLPRTDEDYAGRLSLAGILANTSRLHAIFQGLIAELFNWQHWGIFWPLLLILSFAAIFQPRLRCSPVVRTLWLLLLLHLLAYVPPFMVTNWKIPDLMGAASDRLTMHMVPIAAILIGLMLPAWSPRRARSEGALCGNSNSQTPNQ